MYIPAHFLQRDDTRTRQIVESYPFGLLVTTGADGLPVASHIPFLSGEIDGEWVLEGHVAAPNGQAAHIRAGASALVVFQGPHAYISPTWYETPGVPTWNYDAVHVYGRLREVSGEPAASIVERLANRFEGDGSDAWVPDYAGKMLQGIVAFVMGVQEVQSKSKMSQNRPEADRTGVIEALGASDDQDALGVLEVMRDNESRKP